MSKISHINVIERYEEHRVAIHQLLSSILSCFADEKLFDKKQDELSVVLDSLCSYYPFVSLLYLLDAEGRQISANLQGRHFKGHPKKELGADRSHRPYYLAAINSDAVAVTDPYLSSIRSELCLSSSVKTFNDGKVAGVIVLDVDLDLMLAFLTGDNRRVNFDPYFKFTYSIIIAGLFSVTLLLLYLAGKECWLVLHELFTSTNEETKLLPFGVVIYLTLALAIFDLGKTTLEEEVLLYKDILRHSSTRRTITRFISAIIIAVSIEALLMVFKSALQESGGFMIQAVWVILAAGFLLLCLAVYVYLGSKAEVILTKNRTPEK